MRTKRQQRTALKVLKNGQITLTTFDPAVADAFARFSDCYEVVSVGFYVKNPAVTGEVC